MEKQIDVTEWRNRRIHRRCAFCEWCSGQGPMEHRYAKCAAKNRIMSVEEACNLPRVFCTLYQQKARK